MTFGRGQRRTTVGIPSTGLSATSVHRKPTKKRTTAKQQKRSRALQWIVLGILIAMAIAFSVRAGAQEQPKTDESALSGAFAACPKDPDSAKIRDLKYKPLNDGTGGWIVCEYINAKNSYRGYTGYRRFYGIAFPSDK